MKKKTINKIWDKGVSNDRVVDMFTRANDAVLDMQMAEFDVLGSLAHSIMLEKIGLLNNEELKALLVELKAILKEIESDQFTIDDGVEDIHSQVEGMLIARLGDVGKKIHSGRSRNDQVLLDLKLFFRAEIEEMVGLGKQLFYLLIDLAKQHKDKLMPGYTHLQLAMPSSFGLWFSAYAESLTDDLEMMHAAWKVVNKNPLGSAAGYGSSFPLDRSFTTMLLGFEKMNVNVVYAQMGRGKAERILTQAMASLAQTLSRMSMDITLYLNQHFGFISFPEQLTTGSSIMPHKKNPDVFELIRARCNHLIALPNEVSMITTNLPSGYHRDLQQIKAVVFPAIGELKSSLQMMHYMLQHIEVKDNVLESNFYDYLFSVEEVNELVLSGMSFRDAYICLGQKIAAGNFKPKRKLNHTHQGSLGNLGLSEIIKDFESVVKMFDFEHVNRAFAKLKNWSA